MKSILASAALALALVSTGIQASTKLECTNHSGKAIACVSSKAGVGMTPLLGATVLIAVDTAVNKEDSLLFKAWETFAGLKLECDIPESYWKYATHGSCKKAYDMKQELIEKGVY